MKFSVIKVNHELRYSIRLNNNLNLIIQFRFNKFGWLQVRFCTFKSFAVFCVKKRQFSAYFRIDITISVILQMNFFTDYNGPR